jgi:Xaa-Pro aminopeptidase
VAPSANLSGQSKKYCELETVTMVPIQTTLIDTELLTAAEIDWLNAYHARVRGSIEPLLSKHFPEALSFLMDRTRSI